MVSHESRMLIDGKLVESETGRQFDNINPATEAIPGATSDGTRAVEIVTETKTVGWPAS